MELELTCEQVHANVTKLLAEMGITMIATFIPQDTTKPIKLIMPELDDVTYCLVSDSEADEMDFSEWANNFGYDDDSMKAKTIYDACVDTGRKLRIALGADKLNTLREAFQGF